MGALTLIALLLTSRLRAFIERHAVRIELGECGPYFRFVQWGWCGNVAFIHFALPSWSYERVLWRNEYALMQRVVAWSSLAGWFTYYRL